MPNKIDADQLLNRNGESSLPQHYAENDTVQYSLFQIAAPDSYTYEFISENIPQQDRERLFARGNPMSRDVFLEPVDMRIRYLRPSSVLALALIIAACDPSIERTFPPQEDVCADLGRALTDRERLEEALTYAYDDTSLVHFQQFKAQRLGRGNSVEADAIVGDYLRAFPDCCAVLAPAYLAEEWPLDVVQEEYDNGILDDWNRDVKIARRPRDWGRFDQLKGTLHWHKRMNACSEITDINRG
jgi:hypothetical protein